MACCPTEVKYGYDDSRFERDVDDHFHCSICYNVLKEPRSCRNNDHMFCLDCITEHLNVNSQTCPECNEDLSVDTLRRPRVLNNYLSKLKIKCDHASRGCPEFVCVEDLTTHVANCGFAPVSCSNENCGAKINKKDKVRHETVECEYRTVKCHDCGQVRDDVGALKGSLVGLERKVEAVDRKMEATDGKLEEFNAKMEASRAKTINEVAEVKKEVNDVKENLCKVNKDVQVVKVMMSQILERFNILELSKKPPSPTEGMLLDPPREDILIAGGEGHFNETGKSTEIFSWEKNGWFEMSSMQEERKRASSFIYNDQVFIVGGDKSDTIETLDLDEFPLEWTIFPGKLTFKCDDHQTVVYQQRVFHIGGYDYSKHRQSHVISEMELTPTCTMKELCQMPEPRECHRAEVVGDKIFILGGRENDFNSLDSVLKFDPKKNKCRKMPPLPHPLAKTTTVPWRDQVVVIGGYNKGKILNDVFMYDCKTGKITALPSMLEKREGCCAVITGNTIVVMGGLSWKSTKLESVECFTMGDSTWKYLPNMNNARSRAVAVALPPQRKYV
ncbi:kelch domain-containing protein 8B-like [Dendronephthya gigantea]|uniref:kelch domain-containing protein 8B-like n=1 Tax=Dendronephthya gigantea TaxID=151771 RepID=UPI00106D7C22|nr:kelch domain-containing protein 8B-like [Dendronephthya gigantea]